MKKQYECLICPNRYDELEDLMHHMNLEHVGISPKLLDESTKSRETKKQLGNYINQNNTKTGFECCHCFELFSSIDKLSEHGRVIHKVEFNPGFFEKLQELKKINEQHPPICQKCNKQYLGLVVTRMDGKIKNVCFNCYEGHYGANALLRLTIGTPEKMVLKMKTPLV